MEKVNPDIGPLTIFLKSPEVRRHLLLAGKELALAFGTGLDELHKEAQSSGLVKEYPYLGSALTNLKTALLWCDDAPTTPKAPVVKKATKRKRKTHAKRKTK